MDVRSPPSMQQNQDAVSNIDICDATGIIHQVALHAANPYEQSFCRKVCNRVLTLFGFRRTVLVKIKKNAPPLVIKVNDLKKHIGNKQTVDAWATNKFPQQVKHLIYEYNLDTTIRSLNQFAPDILNEESKGHLRKLASRIDFRKFVPLFRVRGFRPKKLLPTLIAIGRNLPPQEDIPLSGLSIAEQRDRRQYAIHINPDTITIQKQTGNENIELDIGTLEVNRTVLPTRTTTSAIANPSRTRPASRNLFSRLFSVQSPERSPHMIATLEYAQRVGFTAKQRRAIIALGNHADHKNLLSLLGQLEQQDKIRMLHTYVAIGEQYQANISKKYVGRKVHDTHFAFAINGDDVFINTNFSQSSGGFKRITGGFHLNTLEEFVRIKLQKNIGDINRAEAIETIIDEANTLLELHETNNPHLMVPLNTIIRCKDKIGRDNVVLFQTRYQSNGSNLAEAYVYQQIAALSNVAGGLSHMHRHGFIHCDVKPANFLIEGDLIQDEPVEAKISDFGAIRRTGERLLQKTPFYLAPEAQQSAVATPELDAFAFGISVLQTIAPGYTFRNALGRLRQEQRNRTLDEVCEHIRSNRHGLNDMDVECKLRMLTIARSLLLENPEDRLTCGHAAVLLDELYDQYES